MDPENARSDHKPAQEGGDIASCFVKDRCVDENVNGRDDVLIWKNEAKMTKII